MFDSTLAKNIRYYGIYQLIYIAIVIILSSLGAFFHFLLNHEISIVESWLHNNQWEIIVFAKCSSLFLLNRWFKVKLYELKSIRQLVKEFVHWPDPKAIVISLFMVVSYLSLSGWSYSGQNLGYWYYHLVSFVGLFLFFGIEFVVIAYLDEVLNQKEAPNFLWAGLFYTGMFAISFRISVPDYYQLLPYIVLCFASLLYLSGNAFKSWSNVVCYLLLFVAPMGPLFGLDPVWGDDFSIFRVEKKLGFTFLAVIWMISFLYYKYRDQIVRSTRKLLR